MYLMGSLKFIKLNINPKPKTALGVDCETALVSQAEWLENGSKFPSRLPHFMWLDQENRRIGMFIPRKEKALYLGRNFQIRIRNYIMGRESDQRYFYFKVAIISTQIMNCPHYYGIMVP